jgi:hypothetical protein
MSRTLTAPWAARRGHTSVIDARTRAIYVIGGHDGTAYFSDVWLSTDGGARTELARGMVGVLGVLKVLARYSGVPRGFVGVLGVLEE